jgi:Xaa-Pro aminopeptidase
VASNIFDIYFRNTSARFLHAEARIRSGERPMEEALKHELESRRQRVLAAARAQGAEAVLVFATDGRGYNLRYLTNFAPIFGDAFLVLTPVRTVYFLNFNWEIPRARQASDVAEFIATFDLVGDVTRILRELDVGDTIATVGFDRIPHPFYLALVAANPGMRFVDVTLEVERARRIKSAYEVAQLRRAVAATDAAFTEARAAIRPGMTEAEVAALVDQAMKRRGVSEVAFPANVVSGPERAQPVGLPTDRRLRAGDVVMLDIGATWNGYHADLTRTYTVGRPTAEQQALWDVVREAWQRVVDESRPGVPCRRLHEVAVAAMEARGHRLVHRIGHGIGLHTSLEWPNLQTDDDELVPGMTFCIEPGVYVSGVGSFKLEDDFVVTPDGFEVLSQAPRDLA